MVEQTLADELAELGPLETWSDQTDSYETYVELPVQLRNRILAALRPTDATAVTPKQSWCRTCGNSLPNDCPSCSLVELVREIRPYAITRRTVPDELNAKIDEALVGMPVCATDAAVRDADIAYGQNFIEAVAHYALLASGREQGPPCENCGKPVEAGQVVIPWDDAGEMHANCDRPFDLHVESCADTPSPVVLLGSPMRQIPLAALAQLPSNLHTGDGK